MADKTLLLVDGSYYLFRAYFATNRHSLSNAANEPTGAIFGIINMLTKLLAEQKPDYIAVVFDAKGKSFRNDMFPEYKATRPPAPEDLVSQIQPVHEIIRAQGIPLLMIDGVEADDVIATLALQAQAHGIETTISSGDKDLAQIVNDHITVINTMNNSLLNEAGVREKFGVDPGQIVDYLALVGDNVDNVPGVPKVGPKTAAKWLNEYGTLEGIVEHADAITGKVGESLRAHLDNIPLSRKLVTLKTDVELDVAPEDLVRGERDLETLIAHYRRWEFRNMLSRLEEEQGLQGLTAPDNPEQDQAYDTVTTRAQLDKWMQQLGDADLIAFDTETTSLDYMQARIVGVSFSVRAGAAAYVPLAHDYPGCPEQLDREMVLERLRPLLEADAVKILGHNLKYDMSVLKNHGINLQGIAHDTMLESYIYDSTATRHDMDSLAGKYLQYQTTHYEDIAGKGAKQLTFNEIAVEYAAPYAAEDADVTLRLHEYLWPRLNETPALARVYEELEVPLISVLSRLERNGVKIDADALHEQSNDLLREMQHIETAAHEAAGQTFNISSPKQIQTILFEKMGLPVHAKTPGGQPSTAESALQDLAEEHELPRLILEYRGLSKLKSTYTDRLPQQINPDTGRVHASFHQAVASTGRLSSSDPNLQNIPIRSATGRKIRQAFIARPGYRLMAADYSQIELRIMAHLSGDPGLLKAFSEDQDIHRLTAAEVFSLKLDEVSDEQRRAAKAINFGLIYGMSAFGLARQLGIARSEAKEYVDKYFDRYPGVRDFMENTKAGARESGYVETLFGRRLYLPEINSRNPTRRQYAERTAINAPMQGTAADIIKRAMIVIDRQLTGKGDNIYMIMQVHDELVFEVAEDQVDDVAGKIREHMESAASLDVPLVVDVGVGDNWDEAH